MDNTAKMICEDCGKAVRGRNDKRFCDDTCRNNFNRRKKQAERIPIGPEALAIIRIIKRNYQLLKYKYLEDSKNIYHPLDALLEKGFNPDYFTSTKVEYEELYYFCFECGFRISEGRIHIIQRTTQIQTCMA
jgi:predicted nucleic acid-binding Zn ribbon protein